MPIDDKARERLQQMARDALRRNDPAGWFEELYKSASGDASIIPWADCAPNPNLLDWLNRERVQGDGRRAIVVGCGLGDDANELHKRGFKVTAFDISSTAIEWARQRFSDVPITFEPADLLNLPGKWQQAFDFVFESYTVQALPHMVREKALKSVASLVAPNGQLLFICRAREEHEDKGNLPWPLTKSELTILEDAGLSVVRFEDFVDGTDDPPAHRFRVLFRRAG